MYVLVLIFIVNAKPAMTSVDMIGPVERCQAMGEQFKKATPYGQFICLKR